MAEEQKKPMDWGGLKKALGDKARWSETGEFELLSEALYNFGKRAGYVATNGKDEDSFENKLNSLLSVKLEKAYSELLSAAKDRVKVPAEWEQCQRALRDCGIFDELRIVAEMIDYFAEQKNEAAAIGAANVAINSIKDAIRKVFGWLRFPFKKLFDLLLDIIDEILDLLRILAVPVP